MARSSRVKPSSGQQDKTLKVKMLALSARNDWSWDDGPITLARIDRLKQPIFPFRMGGDRLVKDGQFRHRSPCWLADRRKINRGVAEAQSPIFAASTLRLCDSAVSPSLPAIGSIWTISSVTRESTQATHQID